MTRQTGEKYCASPWGHAGKALPYLLILCSVACATPAKADTIIGNLSSGNSGGNSITSGAGWAISFTMGSIAYMLSDIRITLAGMVVANPTFTLESDNGAPSDNVLVTFVDPTFGSAGGIQTFTFTPASSFTLVTNTTYWLTATSASTTPTHWENSSGPPPLGAGATYGTRDESPDGGVTWGGAVANINLFEVDGTSLPSTPEPGSSGLAIIGLALFLFAAGWKTLVNRRLLGVHAPSVVEPLNGLGNVSPGSMSRALAAMRNKQRQYHEASTIESRMSGSFPGPGGE